MPERMGVALWPGVTGFVSASYTVSHDAGAGVASLEIPEQDVTRIRSFGDLVISDGFGSVTLRGCRISDIGFSASPSGARTVVLSIVDRRWQWRYGAISGQYNQLDPFPDPDLFPPGEYVIAGGPYAPGTYRLAHHLMADCLVQMGERKLPLIDPAPAVPVPVQWDDDNPADALSGLAAQVGYRLVYQPNADRVLLAPAGRGAALPSNLPIVSASAALDLPERPSTIILSGGPTVYHDALALMPVGEEKSGLIRPIDKLSYAPANGWATCNAATMFQARATQELSAEEARDLARRHVWRTFRVKMVDVVTGLGPGPNVAGFGRVRDRAQIVLLPSIYDATRSIAGQPDTRPAECFGRVRICNVSGAVAPDLARAFDHTQNGPTLPWRPTIDTARGLVTFPRQMYQSATVGGVTTLSAPDLYLYTGFQIRSVVGRVFDRFRHGGTLAGLPDLGCPAEVLKHPELVRIVHAQRREEDRTLKFLTDNTAELLPAAAYYLNAANAKYGIGAAEDRTYAGIVPIDPDGAITQVTWSVGGGQPATTRVSRNSEHATYLPSFPERRRVVQLRALANKADVGARALQAPPPARPYVSQNPEPIGGY